MHVSSRIFVGSILQLASAIPRFWARWDDNRLVGTLRGVEEPFELEAGFFDGDVAAGA